jgi:uncharacterized protein (DUF3084 family)
MYICGPFKCSQCSGTAALTAERDQLRAENATLRAAQKACEACDEPTAFEVRQLRARAERAEVAETVALSKWNGVLERAMKAEADLVALGQCHDDNCRGVVKIAEELTAERARLRGLAAAQREIDQCIKEARAACQPYGPRQSRKLVWWRGKFDGLVAASAMLTLANFPNQPENARQIDAAMKEGTK